MPELPDIVILARSMDEALRGKTIAGVTINQPKCLNLTPEAFTEQVTGRRVESARQRGKWVLWELDNGSMIAHNLGMGGEAILHKPGEEADPERERIVFHFADGSQLWVHHWWFGHVHLLDPAALEAHKQISSLGPEPLHEDFTVEKFTEMLAGRRGRIKGYLLDQKFMAGIGNVYIQDILWYARLHPNRPANSLSTEEIAGLHAAIQRVLNEGIEAGGARYEHDVYGQEGTYSDNFKVGYRTGEPCPTCHTPVEEIRVGQTTSYICPQCQIQEQKL